jgi:plastocyanin
MEDPNVSFQAEPSGKTRHIPLTSFAALALAAALVAAGCGSSKSKSSSSESTPAPAAPATTAPTSTSAAPAGGGETKLALAADPGGQLKFDKSSLSAKAGKVTIDFANSSPLPHNVAVASSSGAVAGETPTFQGGSKTVTVTLKAGTYKFYCTVPGHRQAGMEGTLTVQ